MSRLGLWAGGAAVAAIAIVVSTLGLLPMLLAFLLAYPLVNQPGGGAALSGLLTAFGAVWLVLLWWDSSSGGVLDNATFWIAVGVVPLVAGLALFTGLAFRERAPAR